MCIRCPSCAIETTAFSAEGYYCPSCHAPLNSPLIKGAKPKTKIFLGKWILTHWKILIFLLFVVSFPIIVFYANCASNNLSVGQVIWSELSDKYPESMQTKPKYGAGVLSNVLYVIVFGSAIGILFLKNLTTGQKIKSCFGYLFVIFFIVSIFRSGGTSATNPNSGYMSEDHDAALTSIGIKKGYGESLTPYEQDFLDKAEAGKFGKPYDNRPDKSKDGVE